MLAFVPCPGCGGRFAHVVGPTHAYMESSPGCWAAYGALLATVYADASLGTTRQLAVDAYAVQHPGQRSAQSIQSVAVHLISLCLAFEGELDPSHAVQSIRAAVSIKDRYHWLAPPSSAGGVTIADLPRDVPSADVQAFVRRWAAAAWSAWSPHHAVIRSWLPAQPTTL
jgi:hypothetical protein